MAAIGKVGTYGSDRPLENFVGQAMAVTEDNAFRYRAEKRLEDDKIKAAKDAADKELADNIAKFGDKATGVYNLDNVSYKLAEDSRNRYADLERQIRTNPANKFDLKMQQQALLDQFNMAKQQKELFLAKQKEVQENVAKGIYNPDAEKELLNFSKSFDNMNARVDDGGIWRFSSYQTDPDGNRTGVVLNDTDMAGIISKMNVPKKSIYEDRMKDYLANNKLDKTKIQRGFTTTTNEKVNADNIAAAKLFSQAIVNNPDEMYQKWLELKGERKTSFTDEEKQLIAQEVEKDAIGRLATNYEKDIDQSGALANRKYGDDRAKETPTIGTGSINIKEGVIDGTNVVSPEGTKIFAIDKAERKFGDGKIQRLKEVRRKPDGSYQYVVEETFEGNTTKKTAYTEKGKAKVAENEKLKKAGKKELPLDFDDYEEISTANKAPTVIVFDTNTDADDAENFAIMLENPNNARKFKGLNQANRFFDARAGAITSPKAAPTADELIKKYSK